MTDNADKINHFNLALRAIRSINRLIVRTREKQPLLDGICDILVKNRGYDRVWLVAFNDAGGIDSWAESGTPEGCAPIDGKFQDGSLVYCARRALKENRTVLILNPSESCVDCPLAHRHEGWAAMTTPMKYGETTYGLISVSIPGELISEDIERSLVEEIAGDIAYALFRLQRDEAHQRADELLKAKNRELNCLYCYSAMVDRPGITLEQVLAETVDLLPPAMQHPTDVCVAIALDNHRFESGNYREAETAIRKRIHVDQQPVGWVMVGHIGQPLASVQAVFSADEQKLVSSIAERLGKTIERKRGRQNVKDSEKRFRDLVENALTCIAIIQNDRVVYHNPEYRRLFGTSDASMILPDFSIRNIHPDDADNIRLAIEPFFKGKARTIDIEFRICENTKTKLESVTWLHGRLNMIEYQGKPAVLVYMMDVSRTKELESLLKIKDKMSSLGRVAAGIAHEIRNPLSGINIYIKALGSSYDRAESPEKIHSILSQIRSASNKIESVIKRVMDFSRPGEPHFRLIDPNLPVEEAIQMSAVTLRKSDIRITYELEADLPTCRADCFMLEQVILNLISNAADAMKGMPGDKHIHLATSSTTKEIQMMVHDTGPGVPKGQENSIFDPFYTTKKNNSGIGLSICHRIITDHHGSLEVSESHLGGALFVIRLPSITQEQS